MNGYYTTNRPPPPHPFCFAPLSGFVAAPQRRAPLFLKYIGIYVLINKNKSCGCFGERDLCIRSMCDERNIARGKVK